MIIEDCIFARKEEIWS